MGTVSGSVVGRGSAAGLALLLLVPALACTGRDATESGGGLTAERFVEVIVELREAEREALDTDSAETVFARRKAEILERHGTTEEELRAFAESSAGDLPESAAMWEEISRRLRRPATIEPL